MDQVEVNQETSKMWFSGHLQDEMTALSRAQAMISFKPDGTVISANENFCAALGYSLEEIRGQHHKMFCDSHIWQNDDYAQFWKDLKAGHYQRGQFKRRKRTVRPSGLKPATIPFSGAARWSEF